MIFLSHIKRNFKLILLLIVLTPVVLKSTAPLEPPYHEFYVFGTVDRSGGGPTEGISVVLLVVRDTLLPDSLKSFEVFTPQGTEWQLGSRYFAFTNELGEFFLAVRSRQYLETISPAVMLTDTIVTGDTLAVNGLGVMEYSHHVRTSSEGCCDDPVTTRIPYALHYTVPKQNIVVP